jgi:hypothetical protein
MSTPKLPSESLQYPPIDNWDVIELRFVLDCDQIGAMIGNSLVTGVSGFGSTALEALEELLRQIRRGLGIARPGLPIRTQKGRYEIAPAVPLDELLSADKWDTLEVTILKDGTGFGAIIGGNLADGVAGFAATPLEAFEELAREIRRGRTLGNGEPVTTKNGRFVIALITSD